MRRFGVFAGTILIAIVIAGLYGILHDQITYSISEEYFTKFKYRQFGIDGTTYGGNRQAVAVIGFLATWWMGYIISIPVALVGFLFRNHTTMRSIITKAIAIVFVTAILFGIAGFLWAKFHLIKAGISWRMPDDLIDKNDFITVGSIHNFSYLGGLAGLFIALIYMVWKYIFSKETHGAS
jgi:hypothetical protein